MATFKARARALDMLGRQQIAGIPTAISELFKNAHDAYAERVEVDYYRTDGLFVLRDDGVGMSQADFLNRWLTLGTESKVATGAGLSMPPVDPLKPLRHILGEKGIGRLAIAAIGPQVLVLSRAQNNASGGHLMAAFIHWGIFACPGIDLDQVEIPIRTFPVGTLPNQEQVTEMVSSVRQNLMSLKVLITPDVYQSILHDLERFTVNPVEMDEVLKEPSLTSNGHGTHFFILPTEESLQADIDGSNDEDASPLIKALIGFTNTMTPDHEPPNISVAFRDHRREEFFDDLIGQSRFFTPHEFENADHHISGEFDEYGQFKGNITVYGEPTVDHIVPWLPARGAKVDCGPFRIELAYVQGEAKNSTIPQEQWTLISRKLKRIGGLYIYRDGIRVLPYGDSDFDFIDIEKNRTKSAGDYFFSYRRMLGVIQISHIQNEHLIEKAGREGFRQNKAYRQFRAILSNFFVQIAVDFFRDQGSRSEVFTTRKREFDLIDKIRKKRDTQVRSQHKVFKQNLDKFFSKIENLSPEDEAEKLAEKLEIRLENALANEDAGAAVTNFIDVEASARKEIEALRQSYRVTKPRGIGLTKQLRRDWDTYSIRLQKLDEAIFAPLARRIDETIVEKAREARFTIDRRRRLERTISDIVTQARRKSYAERNETRDAASAIRKQAIEIISESEENVDNVFRDVLSRLSRIDITGMNEDAVASAQTDLEIMVTDAIAHSTALLQGMRDQMATLNLSRDEEEGIVVGEAEVRESIDEELLALRERAEEDFELVQLGMAIEVINHEFGGTVNSIRDNLRALTAWTGLYPDLDVIERELRASFEHLDAYLELFTPLHKRLYRKPIEFTGDDIETFLRRLFRERLQTHQIKLEATDAFKDQMITGFPSTFYPVFVNLVDNALHWVQDRPDPRIVRLEAFDGSFIVSDTGPGVSIRDRESIFDRGFTRKSGGRGMGLKISKDVLAKVGYTLELLASKTGEGASFRISPTEDEENEENDNDVEDEE